MKGLEELVKTEKEKIDVSFRIPRVKGLNTKLEMTYITTKNNNQNQRIEISIRTSKNPILTMSRYKNFLKITKIAKEKGKDKIKITKEAIVTKVPIPEKYSPVFNIYENLRKIALGYSNENQMGFAGIYFGSLFLIEF